MLPTWVIPADSTDLEQVISCSSVSCLINMEPLELLRLQPSELIHVIASESVAETTSCHDHGCVEDLL